MIAGLLLSVALPRKTTGKAYFKQILKKNGFNIKNIPDEFINDCLSYAEKTLCMYKAVGKSKIYINAQYVRQLDLLCSLTKEWLENPTNIAFRNLESPHKKIFSKYDINKFIL